MRSATASLKTWKKSASVILVAKTSSQSVVQHDCNYKILTVKRSGKSRFLPDNYVFPGGQTDKSDASHDWLKLYERFSFTPDCFEKLVPKYNRSVSDQDSDSCAIPKHVSLRITAIRETFEECGILICRKHQSNKCEEEVRPWASFLCTNDILKWQEKVIRDPLQFYQLCTKFELYPDIWSLHEWSNWAGPAAEQIRFNTVFFLAAFKQIPATTIDNKEIQRFQWASPFTCMVEYDNRAIILPPPQYYEISRLQNFSDVDKLVEFAASRAIYGTERYLPYRVRTNEGLCSILPGDDLYPEFSVLVNGDLPYLNPLPETRIQHRMENRSLYETTIKLQNFTPHNNHAAPLINSKL